MKKFLVLFLLFCVLLKSNSYAKDKEIVLNAKNALVYDWTYNEILYEKNPKEKIPNASTTKILTAIVAYENADMEALVEVGENAPKVSGSKIGLKKGDIVKMDHLMKGLLISSGNDAAIAIAEYVGGNLEDFCGLMNQKAQKLGAKNTNFITPHGLDAPEHYSTIEDLLEFSKSFMKIQYLKEIANMEKTIIKINDYEKEIRATNEMLFLYDGVNGIKTGYTSKAGRCLITSMVSGDRNIITMVFGCDSKVQRTDDTQKLLVYGYENFEEIDICEKIQKNHEIRLKKAKFPRMQLVINGKKKILIKKGLKDELKYEYQIPIVITAPIPSGSLIGNIKVYIKDKVYMEIPVKISCDIEKKGVLQYFYDIFEEQNYYIEVRV